MDEIPSDLNRLLEGPGVIHRVQTTFVDVRTLDRHAQEWRIHFGLSLRRSALSGSYSKLSLSDKHPLCVPYEEDTGRVAINCGPRDAKRFLAELQDAAHSVLLGWVEFEEFLNPYFATPKNLPSKTIGQLFAGPMTLVKAVIPVLEEEGVDFTVFEHHHPQPRAWAMTFDGMFVVATEFRVEARAR